MLKSKNSVERLERKAAYMRAYNQRTTGAVPVKDVWIKCARCGVDTEKRHRAHDWCAACVRPGQLERRREKRAASGTNSVGASLSCRNCNCSFRKEHKRQFYCDPCSELSAKDALPAYRLRQREYQKSRNKRRRREIPSVAIHARMSAGISNSLRDGKNGRSWESLVGFTISDLMTHLERQFMKGMTWENRGEWHIDHIRPLSSFSFETAECPAFKEAWSLTNLRPLWRDDNLKKSGKRLFLL